MVDNYRAISSGPASSNRAITEWSYSIGIAQRYVRGFAECMKSMKLVIPSPFISWKNSFSDISVKCIQLSWQLSWNSCYHVYIWSLILTVCKQINGKHPTLIKVQVAGNFEVLLLDTLLLFFWSTMCPFEVLMQHLGIGMIKVHNFILLFMINVVWLTKVHKPYKHWLIVDKI